MWSSARFEEFSSCIKYLGANFPLPSLPFPFFEWFHPHTNTMGCVLDLVRGGSVRWIIRLGRGKGEGEGGREKRQVDHHQSHIATYPT